MSPDGKHVVYVSPGPGTSNLVFVADIAGGPSKPVARADGQPMRLTRCGWSSSDRLVCQEDGLAKNVNGPAKVIPYVRMFAMDLDGKNVLPLGKRDTVIQLYSRQFDGQILDWLKGVDGKVLMTRYYVPEMTTGRRTASTDEGYGVDLIDTRTQKATRIEQPKQNVEYYSDGRGAVRLMVRYGVSGNDQLTGKSAFYYRTAGDRKWRELGVGANNSDLAPLAVDSGANAAYVLKDLEGRRALYRISLDGSLKTELVFAHPQVDVDNVVTIGRAGRVIGASYATDTPHIEYFDPTYRQLAASIARALPNLPLIGFVSADANEQVLLIWASSDNDPGHFYVFDRGAHRLSKLMSSRPGLQNVTLAHVKAVQYPATDGCISHATSRR
jgi:hypothetical protein